MANIQDVARHAGVSISTVSRVLNGNSRVNSDVRKRVEASVQALAYQPNLAARSLRTNRSRIIGLLISDIQNPFFMGLIRGVEDEALRHEYSLILCNSSESPQREQQYLDVLYAERVAGAIIVPTREQIGEEALQRFKERGIPIVAVDRRVKDKSVDAVLVDNVRGSREAVAHLIGNGYRRIGMIAGSPGITTGRERLEGYRQALQEGGIPSDTALKRYGNFTIESGHELAEQLLDLTPSIDALFVGNNMMTLGALKAIQEREMRVPDDIGLVGYDDIQWADLGSVSLTTVIQPAYELGSTAALRLFQRLQNPSTQSRQEIILDSILRVRASSRPRAGHELTAVQRIALHMTPMFTIAEDGVDPSSVPQRVLYTGARMPAIGLGTFGSDRVPADAVAAAVVGAAGVGYRHFDCASVYGNEKQIGKSLQVIMDGGIARGELWITSKLWNDKHAPADVIPACRQSLSDLGLDYLDMYLVHWPFPNHHDPGADVHARSAKARPYIHEEYMATWRKMEKLVEMGLIRHIGTSNMTIPKLEYVLHDAHIKPAANEMELHPHFQQAELCDFVLANGIEPVGFSPIGSPNRPTRDTTPDDTVVTADPVIVRIAERLGVHPAVACIKWAVQRGQTPIPFSTRRANYMANLKGVVSEPLTEQDMRDIAGTDKNCRLIKGHVFLWKEGQSWEDLWDPNGVITP